MDLNGDCDGGCLLADNFDDNEAGWTLGTEWEIGPATASSCASGPLDEDPGYDADGVTGGGVAGVVLGGCGTTSVHGLYYLTSPVFNGDAIAGNTLVLQFERWLNSDYVPFMQNQVEVFDGLAWQVVFQTGGSPPTSDSFWNQQSFDVTAYANPVMQIRIGFAVTNLGVYDSPSWNVDNLFVCEPEYIPGGGIVPAVF